MPLRYAIISGETTTKNCNAQRPRQLYVAIFAHQLDETTTKNCNFWPPDRFYKYIPVTVVVGNNHKELQRP